VVARCSRVCPRPPCRISRDSPCCIPVELLVVPSRSDFEPQFSRGPQQFLRRAGFSWTKSAPRSLVTVKEIRLFSSRADEKSLLDEAASPRDGGSVGLPAVMVRAMRAFGGNALAV